ncbi:hypothetical protein Acor_55150 [Acrocarpospora corrugata]|uniref:Tetratricopeptide repeat protein n=1 Tax=Acrocarpospora corrugata TaxID=35763 RepID=A0A5M3W570_9ACTN|nr:tetratricopeptide repeat protein [Acrocarpospora corrugata]GES03449.1 hypothetical protein Acor_55150 [Acrocarpospora corrugata]
MSTVTLVLATATLVVVTVVIFGVILAVSDNRRTSDPAVYARLIERGNQLRERDRLARANRLFTKIASKIKFLRAPSKELREMRGQALLAIGDIAVRQGKLPDARVAYRDAFPLITLPPEPVALLAADVAARADSSPTGLDIAIKHLEYAGRLPDDDLVIDLLRKRCQVAPDISVPGLRAVRSLATNVLRVAPHLEWAAFAQGCALRGLGRRGDAIDAFLRAEQLGPARAATPYFLGLLYRAAGSDDRAAAAFERSLAIDADQAPVLYELAEIHLARGRDGEPAARLDELDDALACLARACELQPGRADYWYTRGLAELERGRRSSGIGSLRRAATTGSRHLPANRRLVELLLEEEDWGQAETFSRGVLQLDPDDITARSGLGQSLYQQHRYPEAIAVLSAIAQPTGADLYFLGLAEGRAGYLERAASDFERCLGKGDHPDAAFCLGSVRSRLADWAGAVDAFDQAEATGTDQGRTRQERWSEIALFRGQARQRLGDIMGAAADLGRAVTLAPDDPRAQYALGVLVAGIQDWKGAAAAFARAAALDPSFAPARFGLGLLSERAADPHGAAEQYAAGLDQCGDWVPGWVRLGAAQVAAGALEQGVGTLKTVLARESGDADARPHAGSWDSARFHCALGHARLGDMATAVSLWARLHANASGGERDAVLRGNLVAAWDLQARADLEAGAYGSARRYWELCHSMDPDRETFRIALVEACLRDGTVQLCAHRTSGGHRGALARARELGAGDNRPGHYLAVAALLDGAADAVSALLSPLPGEALRQRAKYHLALAQLALGWTTEAGSLLDDLETHAAVIGPAYHVARGELAARRGQWAQALGAYCRSLEANAPTAGTSRLACHSQECGEVSARSCGQCGRAFCATHGMTDDHGCARCGPCLTASFTAIASWAGKTGRLDTAADALKGWVARQHRNAGMGSARHLGLILAEQGDFDGALHILTPLRNLPVFDAPLRGAVARMHVHRAAIRVREPDVEAVSDDITEVLRLDPASDHGQRASLLLRDWRAMEDARLGRHEESLTIWREEWRRRPADLRLIRRIAITAYHHVLARESADDAWHLLLACWAAVLHSPAFWMGLAARTGRENTDETVAAVRQAVVERVVQDLRDRAMAEGVTVERATRYRDLEIRWGVELRVAALVAESAPARHTREWPAGFACGPMLLERLAETAFGQDMAESLGAVAEKLADPLGERLRTALSPLGRYRYLIDERRLDDAIKELEDRDPWPPGRPLLIEALIARAGVLHKDELWGEALSCAERAGELGADLTGHVDMIADSSVRHSKMIANVDSDYAAALAVLERGLRLAPDHPDVRSNLGATYVRRARELNNNSEFKEAVEHARIALKYTTDDQTRHLARVAAGNRGMQLFSAGTDEDLDQAIVLLRDALRWEADDDTALLLAAALVKRGSAEAVAGHRARAIALIREEIEHNPKSTAEPTEAEAKRRIGLILFNKAMEHAKKDQQAKAIKSFQEARWYDDDAPTRRALATAHHNHAVQLTNGDRYDEAIGHFEKALGLSGSATTRKMLAQCLALRGVNKSKRGDFYGAKQDLTVALRHDPGNAQIRQILGRMP